MGKALRRKTWIRSPRIFWWSLVCYTILGVLFALVVLGFVLVIGAVA